MKLKSTKTVLSSLFLATVLATGAISTSFMPKAMASEIVFTGASNLRELTNAEIKSPNENPFGLVYRGAITENVKVR